VRESIPKLTFDREHRCPADARKKSMTAMKEFQGTIDKSAKVNQSPAKKPYSRPMLIKLGTLRDLTMATTGGQSNDGETRMRGTPLKTGRGGRNGHGQSRT